MPITLVNNGTTPNDGTGDTLYDAADDINSSLTYLDGELPAKLDKDGGTATSPISGPTPTADAHYVTKAFLTDYVANNAPGSSGDFVEVTGDIMTGDLEFAGSLTNYPAIVFSYTAVDYGVIVYNSSGEFRIGSKNGVDFSLVSNNTVRATIDSATGNTTFTEDVGVGGDFAVVGTSRFGDITAVTEDIGGSVYVNHIEVGLHTTGNRTSLIDFHGDDTNTDYGFRINRDGNNGGANCNTEIIHKGTGDLKIQSSDALGTISFFQNGSEAAKIDTDRSLTNVALKNYREKVVTHNAVSGVIELDLEEGNTHVLNITGNTEWHVSNVTGGAYGTGITIIANFSGDYTLQNCSTTYWTGGTAPDWTASGTDIITAIYIDTKWYCSAVTNVQSVAGTESCF